MAELSLKVLLAIREVILGRIGVRQKGAFQKRLAKALLTQPNILDRPLMVRVENEVNAAIQAIENQYTARVTAAAKGGPIPPIENPPVYIARHLEATLAHYEEVPV